MFQLLCWISGIPISIRSRLHSTIWTGALLGKPMQPMERSLSSSFLHQELLLCPSLLLLLLLPILLQLLHFWMNLFLFLQKLTLRGSSRRANAVFRAASNQTNSRRLYCSRQANAVFRTFSGPREHSISKRNRRSLGASQCSLQSGLPLKRYSIFRLSG